MSDGTPGEEFTTPPLTRDEWRGMATAANECQRLRAVLEQIADTPYWQGVLMTKLARRALGREE